MGCTDYIIMAALIPLGIFIAVLVGLIAGYSINRARFGRTPRRLKKTKAFKSPDYLKMNIISVGIIAILVITTLVLCIVSVIMKSTSGMITISIIDYLLYGVYVFTCLGLIVDVLEGKRRGTNIINDPYRDYLTFYEKNKIETFGRCRICGRPIPKYYGLKKRIKSEGLSRHRICFQADGQHIVEIQRNPDLLDEYKSINKKITKASGFFTNASISLSIFAIVFMVIANEYIAPLVAGLGGCTNYWGMIYGLVTMVPLLSWLYLGMLGGGVEKAMISKRLYYDNHFPLITEALEEGRPVPREYGVPPDYTKSGDKLPSFRETLKQAKQMSDKIKSVTRGAMDFKDIKGVTSIPKAIKGAADIYSDVKEGMEDFIEFTDESLTYQPPKDPNTVRKAITTGKGIFDGFEGIEDKPEFVDKSPTYQPPTKTKSPQAFYEAKKSKIKDPTSVQKSIRSGKGIFNGFKKETEDVIEFDDEKVTYQPPTKTLQKEEGWEFDEKFDEEFDTFVKPSISKKIKEIPDKDAEQWEFVETKKTKKSGKSTKSSKSGDRDVEDWQWDDSED
jgi:hypothetical protein